MITFPDFLAHLLRERKLYTDAQQKRWLSQVTGVSEEAARKWLRGQNMPAHGHMETIAAALGMSAGELQYPAPTATERMELFTVKARDENSEPGTIIVDVPHITLAPGAAVGNPTFLSTLIRHQLTDQWLRDHQVTDPGALKRCRVNGPAMERVLFDGDAVLFNSAARSVVDDKVFALIVADQLRVRRLRRRRDGGLVLIAENPDYASEEVPPDEIAQAVYILGRVVSKSGSGGL